MDFNKKFRSAFIETVRLLCIVLFVYAALNKILDFENFQVQLGQSPLLSAYTAFVSYAVPIVEFAVVVLLLVNHLRYAGLFASLGLMVMFTAYIFIILHFSPFVPCSCGGILEKMNWKQHLIFNAVFVVIILTALLLHTNEESHGYHFKIRLVAIMATVICGTALVTLLFVLSEDKIHTRNNFIRRYPNHPTVPQADIDLKYNGYYFAGNDRNYVYLGNTTAPLTVLAVNLVSHKVTHSVIRLPRYPFAYTAPRLKVQPPFFYFFDGTVSCVFRGNTSDWQPMLTMHKGPYFSLLEPLNSANAIIRATSAKTGENVLGTLHYPDITALNYTILQKQIDGVFDTDGMLLYNAQLDKIIYTYYYRNQFIITDKSLRNKETGHTIDTTSKAQIKIATIHSRKMTTLASQPKIVNRRTATYGKYLFVNSALIGKFEPKDVWKDASAIDVYDIVNKTYLFSFYIYDLNKIKMSDFIVIDDLVISITAQHLTFEKLTTHFYNSERLK